MNRRPLRYLVCSAAFAAAAGIMGVQASFAQASDGEKGDRCSQTSLTELNGAPECEPRIVQDSVTATVATLRAGSQDFRNPYSAADADNKCRTSDRNGRLHYSRICRCEIKVQSVTFAGPQAGLERINKIEKDDAESYSCSADMASVNRTIVSVSTGPDLISILTQELLYCQGCGGGCEGSFQLTTYDTQTGNEYSLSDVVQAAGVPRLPDLLTEDFMARYGSRAGSEGTKRQVEEVLASADPQKTGIYTEAGKAWTNIGDFVFSWADGNLFPVQIPSSILKDGFLKKLNP